jgi:hypothetical protein
MEMAAQDNDGTSKKAGRKESEDDGAPRIALEWRPLVRWGGLCMFIAGVIVILYIIGQGALGMTIPLDAEEILEDPLGPTSLFILCIVGEFMLFPGFVALYFTLRDFDKVKMFMATVLGGFSVVMFMVSRSLIISLSLVSDNYHDATSETLSTAYLASAEVSLWTQHTLSTLALVFLSLASIFAGVVMVRSGVLGRGIGYVAILSGLLTVLTPFQALAGMIVVAFIGLVLMLIWQFTVGIKLFRLGSSGAPPDVSTD